MEKQSILFSCLSRCVFLLMLISIAHVAQAQSVKLQGQVVSEETGKALAYVNIGIRSKNMGTASDEKGNFILHVPEQHVQDTLSFSAIGYEVLSVPILTLWERQPLELRLREKVTTLQEVVVQSRKRKVKKLGVTGRLPVVWGSPEQKEGKDIYEFANFIDVKGRQTELISAHFYVSSSVLDSALFRINLYRNSEGLPGERLVEQSILQRLPAQEGWVSIDLLPYDIYTDEDFYLGIEYLPGTGADKLSLLLGGKLGGTSYSRKSSLGNWERFVGASLSGYVTVRQ